MMMLDALQGITAVQRGLDHRASEAHDMWQLGTLLYEAASGHPYWRDMTNDQICEAACDTDVPLPHERLPVLDARLHAVLCGLLTRAPLGRSTASAAKDMFKSLQ
jgi:serine/threonine protein kinase